MSVFRKRLSKPSDAVRAMIDGLNGMSGRDDISVEMSYFCRKVGNHPCYACAATAAALRATETPVEKLVEVVSRNSAAGFDYDWKNLSEAMNVVEDDVVAFESVMNRFRMGNTEGLLSYFDVPEDHPARDIKPTWYLHTYNWEGEIPKVKEYRDRLIELGL